MIVFDGTSDFKTFLDFLTFFKYYKNVFFRVGTRLFLLIPKRIRIIPDHSSSRVSFYYQNYEFYILGSQVPVLLQTY